MPCQPDDSAPVSTVSQEGRNWFIGAHVGRELKRALMNEAATNKRTLTQQLILILEDRYYGKTNNPIT